MKTSGLTQSAFERKVDGLLKSGIKSNSLEGDIKMTNKTQSDVVQETRRKLFENGYVQYRQYLKRNKDGSYNEEWVDARWQGFNAAFDLLVIELPETISKYNKCGNGLVKSEAVEYDSCIDDCRDSIEALKLGLTIK